jgi:hypothetical protein
MKFRDKLIATGAASVLVALAIGVEPMVSVAQAPQLSIQGEEAAHPKLVAAIREMRNALTELRSSKDDFGGNKAAAIRDTENAIHSVQKALYYRLNMDDAALRRIQ